MTNKKEIYKKVGDDIVLCSDCDCEVLSEEAEGYYTEIDECVVCDNCYHNYSECYDCHEYMNNDYTDIINIDDHTYCQECGEKKQEEEKRNDVWYDAQLQFCKIAEKMGYEFEEINEMTENNWKHGAYMQSHGSCSETIVDAYNTEKKELELCEEEIENLIGAMGGASTRHEDTSYDDMRASGISRDNARELLKMGL